MVRGDFMMWWRLSRRSLSTLTLLFGLILTLSAPTLALAAGYASVSGGVSVSPSPVVIGQNFTISFSLKEVRGESKTFENVAIAILRSDNSFVFDFAMYSNVTIGAYGTWSRSATNYLNATRPAGTYKAIVRGKYAGQWFDFDTTGSGVNPRSFSAIVPDTTKPVFNSFGVTPSSVSVGGTFSISYSISDSGGSGLKQVELRRANDNGGTPGTWALISTRAVSGNGPVSGSFSDTRGTAGAYWYGAHVVDNVGNWNPEPSPRRVTVTAVSADDHGNTCSAATTVNVNSSTAGTINSAGDWDYFRVQVPSSGTLTVYTTGSTDTYGFLKNSSCADIASNDDYNGANFRIVRSVTAGTYYVAVRHYSTSTGTGAYTLYVSFTPSTPTSDRFTWPVDPTNPTDGHVNSGGLTQCQNSMTCYWLSDATENTSTVWYDAQGFQRYNSSGYGWHLGADYNKGDDNTGKPVYPTAPGTVSKVIEDTCSWGRIVLVRHTTSFGLYTSMYAHVNWGYGIPYPGQTVSPSTPIATIGNGASNNCSTPRYPYHLHFEIRRGDSVADFSSYPQGPGYWPKTNSSPCNGSDSSSNNCPQHQVDPNAFIRAHN